MDALSNPFDAFLKRHRRRRQYRRLHGTVPVRKKLKIVRFGDGGQRRFWRIKAVPKLRRLKLAASPLKVWTKLKNAYMNMMIHLAGNVGSLNNGDAFRGKRISKARGVAVAYSKEEFESRLVAEIVKSLMASKELGTSITLRGTAQSGTASFH